MSRAFNSSEVTKLKQVITEGIQVTQEISALKEGMSETVKAVAEELQVKPSVLNKAIRVAFKRDLQNHQEDLGALEEILHATGHIVDDE